MELFPVCKGFDPKARIHSFCCSKAPICYILLSTYLPYGYPPLILHVIKNMFHNKMVLLTGDVMFFLF